MADKAAPVGELIAVYRRRRGMSQATLAGLLSRSESWVSQVERGVKPINRVPVILEIAAALHIPPSVLAPGLLGAASGDEEHPAALRLRLALSGHEVLAAMFGRTDESFSSVPPEKVAEQIERCWSLVHYARYVELGELLPGLISTLEWRARNQPGHVSDVWRQLSETYQVTAAAMSKLDEVDVAWIAADRAVAAAERAEDPLLAIAGDFRLTHAFLHGKRLAQAQRTAELALAALQPSIGPEASPQQLSLWGGLNLVAAVVATRQGDGDRAGAHLADAVKAAALLGEDRNDFHTEFGPTNVRLHQVAVAVELGNAGEALRAARGLDVSGLSAERQARFLIDVARANGQRKKPAEALTALLEAERLTPEQVRTHGHVHELVRDLLRGERTRTAPGLTQLARRVGVLP